MTSIFTNQTPSVTDATDGQPYELGMKFRCNQVGQITAIRYWKAPSETGTHVGKIWVTTSNTPLAEVTFSNETTSGWQEQSLNTPLNIEADITYIVSVNCNNHFPITYDQLGNSIVNGNLASIADGNNGVFGNPNSLPTSSYRNSNYFRDVVFAVASTSTSGITKVSGDNQTGTAGTALANPLVVQVKDGSNPKSGVSVTFDVTNNLGSVSPATVLTDNNGEASTTLTLAAPQGAITPVNNTVVAITNDYGSVTFNATANIPGVTLETVFTSQTPSIANVSDGVPYELGMKFRSQKSGQIAAIRYFKAVSETGTHVGKIWSADGNALATVPFTNESLSGWQQQTLDPPLAIEANKTYIVSVNINSYFALTYDSLASSIVKGNLSSVADGNNGLFGEVHSFPTNSYRNSNYFRDVVFVAGSTILMVSGNNQTGAVGTALPNPLVVRVENANGNSLSGLTVNFTVTNGGGSVSATTAVTDSSGEASTVLTLGTTPSGPNSANTVTATVSGIGSVTFTAQAAPADANAIYLENQKPGTTGWKIGFSQQANNEIAGYATATSVNKGGTIGFKVSLAQPGTFKIDVYRLGYYAGTGGRLMLTTGTLNGVTQPALTLTDTDTRLYEATNWSTSYTLQVGNDWTSGLYIAKLTALDSGKQAQIWFVVRDDASNSDILFQSSFTTFLAYNGMSGHSLYAYNSLQGQRAFKVSFDVPFAQASQFSPVYSEYNKMTMWEYNMVRWLESQSYDVSYVTNIDVHANPNILQHHKVFLSVGHDEYWSLEARNNIEQARDRQNQPLNLGFFSANTCYWRVRFENSNSGQSNRVMACYKDNWSLDPVAPTNKFRNLQNNNPENSLLGVMYTGDRTSQLYGGYDFVISNSSHPYFANTNLSDGDSLTLLVGYEWDAAIYNGAEPNNLEILSQSPVDPQTIDTDLPPGTDYQISNAVRYVQPNGAKVFSTGSIQWAWGLDSDGGITGEGVQTPREDIRVKQITVNILADMGARPYTPDAGIIVPPQ